MFVKILLPQVILIFMAEIKSVKIKIRTELFALTVPGTKNKFARTIPANKNLFVRTVLNLGFI